MRRHCDAAAQFHRRIRPIAPLQWPSDINASMAKPELPVPSSRTSLAVNRPLDSLLICRRSLSYKGDRWTRPTFLITAIYRKAVVNQFFSGPIRPLYCRNQFAISAMSGFCTVVCRVNDSSS